MRYVPRTRLPAKWQRWLDRWTAELRAAPEADEPPSKRARRKWTDRRPTKTIAEVRAALRKMNGPAGTRCMYCESNEAGHLDHFEPLALAPDRTFDWQNLVQACDICDSHHKRDRFRSDAGDRPVDPTAEDPSRHLGFLPSGAIDAKTGRGSWTVELLGLDRQQLAVGRQMRWLSLRLLIPEYASLQASGRPSEARRYANAIQRGPFPSVLRDLVAAADSPAADVFGLSQVRAALVQCPEIRRWAGAAQSNQPIGEGDEEA